MLRKALYSLFLSYISLHALELGYGKGTFDWRFGLAGVMKADVSMDVNILTLRENHLSLPGGFYLSGILDIYRSDTLDDYASYADAAADKSFFGHSASDTASAMGAPVPVSFEMRGIDLSIGLGYDLAAKKDGSYFGIGVQTGISLPYIETKNMIKDAQLFADILDKTKTEIVTYKLMPALAGRWRFNRWLAAEGSLAWGWQYGRMTNDYVDGTADFAGSVFASDMAVRLTPLKDSGLSFVAGWRINDWNVEKMDVSVIDPAFGNDFSHQLDIGFSSRFWYLGAGWRF